MTRRSVDICEEGERKEQSLRNALAVCMGGLMKSMQVCGMAVPMSCESSGLRPRAWTLWASKAWCAAMVVFNWAYFVKYVTCAALPKGVDGGRQVDWVLLVVQVSWSVMTLCQATVMVYHTGSREGLLKGFFTQTQEQCPPSATDQRSLRRLSTLLVAVSWLMAVLSLLAYSVSYVVLPADWAPFNVHCAGELRATGPLAVFYYVLLCVNTFYCTLSWYFSVVICLVISQFLVQQLNTFSKEFKRVQCEGNLCAHLEELRHRHLALSQVVKSANLTVGRILGIMLTVSIPLACFLLYHIVRIVKNDPQPLILIILFYWLVLNITFIFVSAITVARVNDKAHEPLSTLHCTSVSPMQWCSPSHQIQMSLFISKLSDSSIGVQVWGFFVVTKDTVLTLASLYLTYIALVLQLA